MKKIFILTTLLLVKSLLFAQDDKIIKAKSTDVKPLIKETLTAIYDFEKKIYITGELKPKHKQPIVLKIININKIANSVEITTNDVRIKDDFLDDDTKEAINNVKTDIKESEIKTTNLNLDVTIPEKLLERNIVESKNKETKSGTELNKLETEKDNLNKTLNNLNSTINDQTILIDNLNHEIVSIDENIKKELSKEPKTATDEDINRENEKKNKKVVKLDETITAQNNNKKLLKLEKEKINDIEFQINSKNGLLKKLKTKAENLIEKYLKVSANINNINRVNTAYNSYIDFIINPNLTNQVYIKNAKKICAILDKDKSADYYSYITDFDANYNDFVNSYYSLKNSDLIYEVKDIDEGYANLVKIQIDNIKNDVDGLYSKINVIELRKKLNNVEILNNFLSKDEAFNIASNPVQPLEDYVEFNVKIKQNKELGSSIIKENDKDFKYIEYIRQGVRWDVSVGTVFDFGIKNQQYEVQKLNATQFKIIENNSSKYTPTIAGMLHTSFRSNSMFAFGVSLGVSIDVTKLNFNSFFPGVSLLIGKREKMVFTVGPAFKKVNQIKSKYENEGDRFLTSEIQVTDITTEQFKIGYFFGISYNLTSKQKSKVKSLQ